MLERLGVNASDGNLNTRNVAAVMVTANLPPFASQGSRIDVTVSALGDARSLAGGQLLVTPLMGADQQVYAVAQGPLAIGGFAASGQSGSSVTRGVPTAGRIASGALVEREINFDIAAQQELRLALRNPDFTTAQRIAAAINTAVGAEAARAANPGSVVLRRPADYAGDMVSLRRAHRKPRSRSRHAGAHRHRRKLRHRGDGREREGLHRRDRARQPHHLDPGRSVRQPAGRRSAAARPSSCRRSNVDVEEEEGGLVVVPGGVPLRQLVNGLNALGVTPRDMISILQALKAAGAIQAEIEVM